MIGAADRRLEAAHQVLSLAVAASDAYGRPDLADPARAALERLSTPATTVVVAGEYKKGKSTFINSLIGISACPVDDDVSSAVPLMGAVRRRTRRSRPDEVSDTGYARRFGWPTFRGAI